MVMAASSGQGIPIMAMIVVTIAVVFANAILATVNILK
jgi:hypothetical protein